MTSESHGASLKVTGATPLRVIAAFDIGSNSIKMSVARQNPDGSIQEFLWRAETTRLGTSIDQTGLLAADRIEASIDALGRFVAESGQYGATRFIAVATEATRVAGNGMQFLDRLRDELGIEIESITGDQEAALTFAGLDQGIDRRGILIVADAGGGSTEVIEAHDGGVIQSASLPVGSGRLTDRYVPSDPPQMTELQIAREHARQEFRRHRWATRCDQLVVIGGTAEFARRLLGHDWPASPPEIEAMLAYLTSRHSSDLASEIDASVLRARVLPAGIAIYGALIDITSPTVIVGAASGIRTGLLHAAFRGEL
jgi:exopolyphosphatase/pppGpp-phosphohydrolase